MEEILASIRRIISEDDAAAASPTPEISARLGTANASTLGAKVGKETPVSSDLEEEASESEERPSEVITPVGIPAELRSSISDVTATLQELANSVVRLGNDDPWQPGSQDIIGVDRQALALARMAASTDFQPPLAVGLFGAWGSGKSFLMRKIHEQVTIATESGDRRFHQHVVQIRFNAWHYVDADLWASLAGHVFEALDAAANGGSAPSAESESILGKLTTARELTIGSLRDLAMRRRAALGAQEALRLAEAKLSDMRRAFSKSIAAKVKAGAHASIFGIRLWWTKDASARRAVQIAFGRPYEDLVAETSALENAGGVISRQLTMAQGLSRQMGSAQTICLLILAVGAPLTIVGFRQPIASFGARLNLQLLVLLTTLQPLILVGTPAFTTLAIIFARSARRVTQARDVVVAGIRKYRQEIVEEEQRETRGTTAKFELARAQLSQAEGVVAQAKRALETAVVAQAEATRSYSEETPAGRLKALIKSRAGPDGLCRSRQGLISSIRRDFTDLAALMNPAPGAGEAAAQAESERSYARQIEALGREFKDSLSEAELVSARHLQQPSARPPFSRIVLYIDDLDRCSAERVVDVLQAVHLLLAYSIFVVFVAVDVRWLKGALHKIYPQLEAEGSVDRDALALDYLEKIFQIPIWTEPFTASSASRFVAKRLGEGSDTPPQPRQKRSVRQPDQPLTDAALTVPESDFLKLIAPLAASSPRRLLRLINTYRLARAALEPRRAKMFLEGDHRPFALLLALAAGSPSEFPAMIQALQKTREPARWLAAISSNEALSRQTVTKVARAIRIIEREDISLQDLRGQAALVLKYCFAH